MPEDTHYTNRLVRLLDESESILIPNVLINGDMVTEPEGVVERVQDSRFYP